MKNNLITTLSGQVTGRQVLDPGHLYVVATPIGNLQDITLRALDILKQVSLILAEDTRHAKKLLSFYAIQKPVLSFHAHNESSTAQSIVNRLHQGDTIALISDAGTPLIQDPGFPLIRLAIQSNIAVVPIPGPCALITALSAAGVPCDTFLFAGFLPVKTQAKEQALRRFLQSGHTTLAYESTHRIIRTLQTIQEVLGESYSFVLAKELTKTFETFVRGTATEILAYLTADSDRIKGEFVLLFPAVEKTKDPNQDEDLLAVLLEHLPLKKAVLIAEKFSDTPKNELYKTGLKIKNRPLS